MKIALATDHRGYEHKEYIKQHIHYQGVTNLTWMDVGAYSTERSDYPIFAHKACELVVGRQVDRAILLCGSGIGMSIAANRYKGIYAALVWSDQVTRVAAQEDNPNILVLPADFMAPQEAVVCIQIWLQTPFKGGHYQERLQQIDAL